MQLHSLGIAAIHANGTKDFEAATTGQFRFGRNTKNVPGVSSISTMEEYLYFEDNLALVAIDEVYCIPEWYECSLLIGECVYVCIYLFCCRGNDFL